MTFGSFFAIAIIEFAVPFVAITTLGASVVTVAVLGGCRFAPQGPFARAAAAAVDRAIPNHQP